MTQTTITQSNELLAQFQLWAELQPDRCKVDSYNATPRLKAQSDIALKLGDSWITVWSTAISDISASGLAITQAVVQEAIAAKRWECHLIRHYDYEAPIWEADVTNPFQIDPNGGLGVVYIREHDEAAIALFGAYLAAIVDQSAARPVSFAPA